MDQTVSPEYRGEGRRSGWWWDAAGVFELAQLFDHERWLSVSVPLAFASANGGLVVGLPLVSSSMCELGI